MTKTLHSDLPGLARQTTGDGSLLRSLPGIPEAGAPPFPVIVGVPRSGTTLLRMMLDANPALAIPPETGFLVAAAGIPDGAGARDAVLAAIRSADTWPDFSLLEEDLCREIVDLPSTARADVVRTFYRVYAARFGKLRGGDKTPVYGRHLREIRSAPARSTLHPSDPRRQRRCSFRARALVLAG